MNNYLHMLLQQRIFASIKFFYVVLEIRLAVHKTIILTYVDYFFIYEPY
jgi:hypothetical protein